MSDVLTKIAKISDKIENSPNCGYLYQYFDELVASLDSAGTDSLPPVVVRDLKGLIQDMAVESIYNNVSSANWIRYSARAFFCADYLVRYLPEDQREFFYGYLNGFFSDLVDSGVAPVIEEEVFDMYLKRNLTEENYHTMYDRLIHKAVCEWDKCRLWSADEVDLACEYSKSINRMIRAYTKEYGDYSMLKEWIPKLRISHAVKHRDGYPESTWFKNAGSTEREAVMGMLDKIVQIYGYLHCVWYWHSSEELISTMSTEDLINMFESFDDRAFDDILCNIAEFKNNSKVKDVLMHFAGHNDKVVAGLATQLLDEYQRTIKIMDIQRIIDTRIPDIAPIYGGVRGRTPSSRHTTYAWPTLIRAGLRWVIDLREKDCSESLPEACAMAGIGYLHYPVNNEASVIDSMIELFPRFCNILDEGEFYIACAMGLHRTDIALCAYWVFYAADKGIAPPPIRGYRQEDGHNTNKIMRVLNAMYARMTEINGVEPMPADVFKERKSIINQQSKSLS